MRRGLRRGISCLIVHNDRALQRTIGVERDDNGARGEPQVTPLPPRAGDSSIGQIGDGVIVDQLMLMRVPAQTCPDVWTPSEKLPQPPGINVNPSPRDKPVTALLIRPVEELARGKNGNVRHDADRLPGRSRGQLLLKPEELLVAQTSGIRE